MIKRQRTSSGTGHQGMPLDSTTLVIDSPGFGGDADPRHNHQSRSERGAPVADAADAAQAPDPKRTQRLFDHHFHFIGRVVRNMGVDEGDVGDVLQQVFSAAAKKLRDIPPASERAFLIQAATRWAANARRARARRREVVSDELTALPDLGLNPEDAFNRKCALELLDKVLSNLEEDVRAVFVLFEIEELSTAEIACTLDLPQGTVASRLRRAREAFHKQASRLCRSDTAR